MPDDKRNDFIDWYNEQVENNYIFYFQEELKKYCELDVDILLWSVVEFKNKIKALTKMDPFVNGSTTAWVTMSNYLDNYLPKYNISQ